MRIDYQPKVGDRFLLTGDDWKTWRTPSGLGTLHNTVVTIDDVGTYVAFSRSSGAGTLLRRTPGREIWKSYNGFDVELIENEPEPEPDPEPITSEQDRDWLNWFLSTGRLSVFHEVRCQHCGVLYAANIAETDAEHVLGKTIDHHRNSPCDVADDKRHLMRLRRRLVLESGWHYT